MDPSAAYVLFYLRDDYTPELLGGAAIPPPPDLVDATGAVANSAS